MVVKNLIRNSACERVTFFLVFAIEIKMDTREKEFGIFLSEKSFSTNRGTSVFYKDFGEKIKAAIKDPSYRLTKEE